jgi:hypothetical protein
LFGKFFPQAHDGDILGGSFIKLQFILRQWPRLMVNRMSPRSVRGTPQRGA